MVMNQRRALELALEALENSIDTVRSEYQNDWRHGLPTRQIQLDGMKQMLDQHESAITAIREVLAQPEPEPVAWMQKDVVPLKHIIKAVVRREKDETYTEPLYTSPPQRQPLFDEDTQRALDIYDKAAHGIKEKNNG
jgi:uncharacterized FlgJ-related protein